MILESDLSAFLTRPWGTLGRVSAQAFGWELSGLSRELHLFWLFFLGGGLSPVSIEP